MCTLYLKNSYLVYNPQIEDCLVCSENPSSVLFRPCNHMVACDNCASIMKKCVECRSSIDEAVPFNICCGGKNGEEEEDLSKDFYRN